MALFGLFGGRKNGQQKTFKFEIGDKVLCIDDREHKVVFGKTYVILNRIAIPCCGDFCYDVGLVSVDEGHTHCPQCNENIPGRGIHWAGEFRFAPKVSNSAEAENEEEEDTTDAQEALLEEAREVLETTEALN